MREITTHRVGLLNEHIFVQALDDPAPDGACHQYRVRGEVGGPVVGINISFQRGPLAEAGQNGISSEALLAVVIDHLHGFQSGQFKCRENAIAITHLEDAMHWLHHRTRERAARGVEGTSKV